MKSLYNIKLLLFIGLILLAELPVHTQPVVSKVSVVNDSSRIEEKVLDTIMNLKEVKERATYVIKQTKGRRHLLYTIWQKPTSKAPYYWVKVMEDNGLTYHTHFNFYIYSESFAIKFFDTTNDKLIDLKTWRKRKS